MHQLRRASRFRRLVPECEGISQSDPGFREGYGSALGVLSELAVLVAKDFWGPPTTGAAFFEHIGLIAGFAGGSARPE